MTSLPPPPCRPPARRRWLRQAGAWPAALLAGCAAPWPEVPAGPGSPSAAARLAESAAAQGLAAWRQVRDLSLDLLETPGRPASARADALQLRWLPQQRLLAWQAAGTPAPLQGWRRWPAPGLGAVSGDGADLRLWQAGEPVSDGAALAAAAALADLQRLLLLGPMALVDTAQPVNWAEPATLDGRRCDQLTLDLSPGLGGGASSRLALFIDRDQALMRRLRVMAGAEQGRPDALAATWDLHDPVLLHGVYWPRGCRRSGPARGPGQAPAAWRLRGLDLDRGLQFADLSAPPFSALAARPAAVLPG